MIEQIDQDLKSAMLTGDKRRTTVLRMLKSALMNARIAHKGKLDETTAITTLQKEAKQRQEAAESFEKAGRAEQAEQERAEYDIISGYLPQPLSKEELEALIAEAIKATGSEAIQDMGQVMGWLRDKISGRADGAQVAQTVRQRLGA